MPDAKTLIKNARRRQGTYRVCLRGDLIADHAALEAELEALTAGPILDPERVTDLAGQIKALESEMTEATITLRFESLPRDEWAELVDAHPGRKADERFNFDTFVPAMLAACLVEPDLDADDIDALLDSINEGQRDELFGVAWAVNREDTNVPFSVRASVVMQARASRSKQHEPGASPEASS